MSFLCPHITVRRGRASLCAGVLGQHQAPLSDFLGACDLEQFFFFRLFQFFHDSRNCGYVLII